MTFGFIGLNDDSPFRILLAPASYLNKAAVTELAVPCSHSAT